ATDSGRTRSPDPARSAGHRPRRRSRFPRPRRAGCATPFLHMTAPPRILFVTGKLAEPALRRVLGELAPRAGFEPEVAVLNISVAALMTANWVARHLDVPA